MNRFQWLIADYRLCRIQGIPRIKAARLALAQFVRPDQLPF